MLKEIGTDDERYKIYYPMLGWWYQDHGQWNKSISIFENQYRKTNSSNMLSSMVWGLFNDGQYAEVVKYETEILKLKEHKINFILAKSCEELGNAQRAKSYYEKFSKRNYLGSRIDRYFTDRNDNKFYFYDHSYLKEVADYFSTKDLPYSCRLNKHIYEMILDALDDNYSMSIERKVILAQDEPEQQQIQNEKYQSKRQYLFNELRSLREKCRECESKGL